MRSDGFHADPQGKRNLGVGPILAEQRQDVALARGQQRLDVLSLPVGGEELQLQASRREVDRMAQIAQLGARGEARAGAKCQKLGRLNAGDGVPEQDQPRLGVRCRDLANFAVVTQRSDVENEYAWVVHAEHALDARRRDVVRDERDAWVGFKSGPKTQREQVLETGDGDRDE